MRYFDLLVEREVLPPEARGATVFDASEIAEQIDRVEHVPGGTFPAEYYGVVAPPFIDKPFWIEATTRPSRDTLTDQDYEELMEHGFSREQAEEWIEDHADVTVQRGALCIARLIDPKLPSPQEREYVTHFGPLDGEARWLMSVRTYHTIGRNPDPFANEVIVPRAVAYLVIGRDGRLLSNPSRTPVFVFESNAELARLYAGAITNLLPFTMLSISFLHRRTTVDYVQPNRLERKRAARAMGRKRGAAALKDYYIVRVAPHKEGEDFLSPDDIRPFQTRGKRAHSVRGHFRRVGEKGLFGRGDHANELIYISDHIRGAAPGRTAKEYKIVKE